VARANELDAELAVGTVTKSTPSTLLTRSRMKTMFAGLSSTQRHDVLGVANAGCRPTFDRRGSVGRGVLADGSRKLYPELRAVPWDAMETNRAVHELSRGAW